MQWMYPRSGDPALIPIRSRIERGERLSLEDGLVLYRTPDLLGLGRLAHEAQRRRSGDAVYYVLNQKIEHTNVCVLSCSFCDFAARKGAPDAYEMTTGEIVEKLNPHIHEVHITGGMPPDWPWERYLDIVRTIAGRFPNTDVKAFTAVEIDFFHKKFRMPVEEVLHQLQEAGLRTMPGGGAEVFSERVRKQLFPQKIGAARWLEVHRTAHRLGIPTNSTLLYGHIETLEERLRHMIRLRELQDETGGFLTFIPLAFQPGDTGIKPKHRYTSAIDDLRTIAVSRLMLDNIPHIKAYWVMLTEEVAAMALNFGADDMDGTVGGEKIAHDAGAVSPMTLAEDQIVRIITDAGKVPVKRDVYYNPLEVRTPGVIGRIPYLNSVPFYGALQDRGFRVLPVTPRHMGNLSRQGGITAGPFSLMDYLRQEQEMDLLGWCIASRDQVKSVMLFARDGWAGLGGATIGIVDDTATSVMLLRVLLEKKHGVRARFRRMHSGVNDLRGFDAVLLIGDEALRRNRTGLEGFDLVFDLAREWYEWQKLPFVFAVWASARTMESADREALREAIAVSVRNAEADYAAAAGAHGRALGLSAAETREFLEGFNYHLGEREREAIARFRELAGSLQPEPQTEEGGTVR